MTAAIKPQHLEALEQANRVRLYRSRLKQDLRELSRADGMIYVAKILDRLPSELSTMRVEVLLLSIHKFGQTRSTRTLTKAGISPFRTFEGLTLRQAAALADLLREGAEA
jgi:hypothetical protein